MVGQFNAELPSCLFLRSRYEQVQGQSFRTGAACHVADKGFSVKFTLRQAAGNPMPLIFTLSQTK